MSVEFEFKMRYVDRDLDPYYYTNWDRAVSVTIKAPTRDEAFVVLWNMLGAAPRGRKWVAHIDSVKQL